MHRSRSLILSLALLALLLGTVSPAAQAKRPLTYEDVIAMGRVSGPQISPGGLPFEAAIADGIIARSFRNLWEPILQGM